jgi:hypothetical protein
MTLTDVLRSIIGAGNTSGLLLCKLNHFVCKVEVRIISVENTRTGAIDNVQVPVGSYDDAESLARH